MGQMAALRVEMARLSKLVDSRTPLNSNFVLTRSAMTEADIAALTAYIPVGALQELDMSSLYARGTKMSLLNEMRLFTRDTDALPVFCCGPGVHVAGSVVQEPVWGIAGLYPHLMQAELPFFNGQLPCASPHNYIPTLVHGILQCRGRSIVVFYPPPWSSYLEAAMLMFLVATGSAHVHVLASASMVADAAGDTTPIPNIAGTCFQMFTHRDRQVYSRSDSRFLTCV